MISRRLLLLGVTILSFGAHQAICQETLNLPLVLRADKERIATPIVLPIPFIKESKTLVQFIESHALTPQDEAMIGFLKAIKEKRADDLKNYLDLSNFQIADSSQLLTYLESSYFPEDSLVMIVGKIPTATGAAYLFLRKRKLVDFPILSVVDTKEGPRVQAVNSDKLIDVIQGSLRFSSLDELNKLLTASSSPPLAIAQANLLLERATAGTSVRSEIEGALREAGASGLKTGFTSYSQSKLDKVLAGMNPDQKQQFVKDFEKNALLIDYIVNLHPLYVSVQKPEAAQRVIYYYKDPSSGKLLLTNYSQIQPFDGIVKKLEIGKLNPPQ